MHKSSYLQLLPTCGDNSNKYGSCVVDDSNYIDKSSCPTISSTDGSAALGILTQSSAANVGYGLKRNIVVNFPMSNAQYAKLITNTKSSFQVTLSLNQNIVPNTPVTVDVTVGDKLNGLASSSDWIVTGTSVYHPPVQLYERTLFARYSASSFVSGSTTWTDISGNGRDVTVTGTVLTGTDEFGFPIITGNTTTVIEFPVGGIGSSYTIFYRAKYNGPNKGRILTSDVYRDGYCNWVSGLYNQYTLGAYHGYGWINDNINPDVIENQWLVSTDQLHLYRGNGVDYTHYANTIPACVFGNLGINLLSSERSDWAVSDVIIYSKELTLPEIKAVEASLHVGLTLTPTFQPSARPSSSDRLLARYSASTTITGGKWPDISGNQNDATVTGTVLTGTDEFGFPIITGDTTTVIEFPVGGIGSAYTIFYRAKYNGPNKQRIFTSDGITNGCNWVSGFYSGYSVGAYHGYNWIADIQSLDVIGDQWLVSTDQLHLYRGNGVDYTHYANTIPACVFGNLGINLLSSERSDWAVSDVIIYSKELTLPEIQAVEASLHVGLTLSPAFQPSARPSSSDRLLARYSASTTITGGKWPDISGNQNDATVTGTVLTGTDESGKPIITGDTSSVVEFPVGGIGSAYTIFYRAKYNGPNKGRILTSDGYTNNCDWVSGLYNQYTLGAYHRGGSWITDNVSPDVIGDQWLVSTDQLQLYRGNGVDYTHYPIYDSTCVFGSLGINLLQGERSDWAVSDVIIYSRELSLSEILTVEASLQA